MKLIKIVLQIVLLVVAFLLGTKYKSIENAVKNTTAPAVAVSNDAIIVDEEEAAAQDNNSELEMEISDTEVLETMDSDVPAIPAEDAIAPNTEMPEAAVEATNVETVESTMDDSGAIQDVNVGVESGSVAPVAPMEVNPAQ